MSGDDRYCTNCRTRIPRGAEVCPACGVHAGDVFDGRLPKQKRSGGSSFWTIALLAVLAAAGGVWFFFNQKPALPRMDTGPVRVVGDRPGGARRPAGAAISEPEAMMTVRHYFAAQEQPIKSECLALISRGYSNGFYSMDAFNACDRTKLGRWRVDARTRVVRRP